MLIKLAKQYNGFADKFSILHGRLDRITNRHYYSLFDNIRDKKLLDLGCGEGKDLKSFKSKGAQVFGVDSSENMIKVIRTKLSGDFRIGFFEELPFGKDFFDIVASKYALQTAENIEDVYKEVTRVLKIDGIFCFLVTHPIRQFMEKKKMNKDYFKKELVNSIIFNGALTVQEPTHTFLEYFSPYFMKHFQILSYDEVFDPSNAEMVEGSKYPAFFVIKAQKIK